MSAGKWEIDIRSPLEMLKRLLAMNRHSISHKGSGSLSFVHVCALKRVSMWGTCAYASMHVCMRMASLAI